MSTDEVKVGLGNKLLSIALSAVAAKFAMMAMEQLWTKGLRKPMPYEDGASMATKVAWVGITAAAVGMAREMVKELAAPLDGA